MVNVSIRFECVYPRSRGIIQPYIYLNLILMETISCHFFLLFLLFLRIFVLFFTRYRFCLYNDPCKLTKKRIRFEAYNFKSQHGPKWFQMGFKSVKYYYKE